MYPSVCRAVNSIGFEATKAMTALIRTCGSKIALTVPTRALLLSKIGATTEHPLWLVMSIMVGVIDEVMSAMGFVFSHFCGPMILPSLECHAAGSTTHLVVEVLGCRFDNEAAVRS